MPIERQVIAKIPKRLKEDIELKNQRVGELLQLEKVPLHTLAWKEPRLEIGDGDCYPVIDVIEKMAENISSLIEIVSAPKPTPPAKKAGRK